MKFKCKIVRFIDNLNIRRIINLLKNPLKIRKVFNEEINFCDHCNELGPTFIIYYDIARFCPKCIEYYD